MLMQVILSGLLLGGIYALMAVGLSLTMGVMEIINLAHGVFYALGSFVIFSLITQAKINPFLALFITFVIIFFVGMICERLLVRPIRDSHMHVMIVTFSLAIFAEQCIHIGWGVLYLSIPPFIKGELKIGQVFLDYQRLLSFLIGMATIVVLAIALKKTKLGKATRMVQQDSEMAMILGINVDLISMVVYGLGAALAAAAGCLLAPLYLIFPAMGWTPLLVSFAIVILGGMGSIVGTVVGGLLFGLTMLLTSYYIASGMVNVVPFLAIIVVLLIRPRGIFGKAIL
jgi:branched-chain amino acid transport system permease protein